MKNIRKILNSLLSITLILSYFGIINPTKVGAVNSDFASGTGTKNNPYIIKNAKQLQNINNYCGKEHNDKYFKIVVSNNIIDMKNKSFIPICSNLDSEDNRHEKAFYGHFDGNNTEIINLKIETDNFFGGLFGATHESEIKNITIGKNSSITVNGVNKNGYSWVGGLSASDENSIIENVSNYANVSANHYVGGIVGAGTGTKLYNVSNNANISCDSSYAGGIVGAIYPSYSIVKNATNYGNINIGKSNVFNSSAVGGIVGYASTNVAIENVSNFSSITSEVSNVGGIVGDLNMNSTLKNATNSGKVNATSEVGGIVGKIDTESAAINIFNYNQNIIGTKNIGLLIGRINTNNVIVKNAYTLKENTILNGIGNYTEKATIENIKGYTKEELKNQDSYVGFDFDNVWIMKNGKAELRFVNDSENIMVETNDSATSSNISDGPTIKYNDKTLNVTSYLYNDGRTYVNLNEFCEKSSICNVSIDKKNQNLYTITKNIEITEGTIQNNINENLKYSYMVTHEKGTKEFTPFIIIGGYKPFLTRTIHDDVTNQKSDVPSCPDVEEYTCDEGRLYVPVRYLSQSLGLRVEWDGENNTVNIKSNLVDTFLEKYDVITTTSKNCNSSNCILVKDGVYTKVKANNEYYLNVIEKSTGKIMDYIKLYSFYDSTKSTGTFDKIYTRGIFSINKNKIKVTKRSTNDTVLQRNIAQIIVFEIRESDEGYQKSDYNAGGYPIILNNVFVCEDC